jgi:hypothetical protein
MVHIWRNLPLACETHNTYHWHLLVSRYLCPSVPWDSLFEKLGHPCVGHGIFTEREQPPALANSGDTCCRAANISTTSTEAVLRHKFSMHHNCLILRIGFHIVFYVYLSHSGPCVGSLVHRFILLPITDTNLYIYFNTLNAELNPICHFLALLGTHHILHVSRIRVNMEFTLLLHNILVDL